MTLDTSTFPANTQSVFYCDEQQISGQQWATECLTLAQEINQYDENNWLLYDDDFYQFSQYFFALLVAKKNIILAQSNQLERIRQASELADISIGDFNSTNDDHELANFTRNHSANHAPTSLEKITISDEVCITLFTSGSTGQAKAITKYWYQLANEVNCLQDLFSEQRNIVLSTVTHKHIYGILFKLLWPIFTDKNIICETIEYPEQVEHLCKTFNEIALVSSPSYLSRTSQHLSKPSSQKIKQIFCSGGALSNQIAYDFFSLTQQVITEIYGSTETGGIAWRQQMNNTQWQLFPTHQVTLADDNTLLLQSKFLPHGERYKTDDIVELNGRMFNLLGRVDRIIKLYEKRLSLDEMESVLTCLPIITSCHCFMLDSSKNKASLVAVIELAQDELLPENIKQKKHLVDQCKQALLTVFEASLLPRKWRFIQKLPFNKQGKLVKTELVELFN